MQYHRFVLPGDVKLLDFDSSEQVDQVLSVLENAFKQRFAKKEFLWKHKSWPQGEAKNLILIADGNVAGHWASAPIACKIGPDTFEAQICFDIAFDRTRFGRRDASLQLVRLGRIICEFIESEGRVFGCGFPNTNSMSLGIKRIGWSQVVPLINLSYYLRSGPFISRKVSNKLLKWTAGAFWSAIVRIGVWSRAIDLWPSWGRKIKEIDRFDERVDALWENVCKKIKNAFVRNKSNLNWRFCDPSGPAYKIFAAERKREEMVGYVVVRIRECEDGVKEAVIADVLAKDHNPLIASQLILAGLRYALKKRCDVVRTWCPRHSPYYHYFRAAGFLRRKSNAYLCLRVFTPNPVIAKRIMTSTDWHIMMSDSDSV
ncbi:hypothetical protein J7M28_04380 [bacterium]|nr:hypothetical protein [bacterium]